MLLIQRSVTSIPGGSNAHFQHLGGQQTIERLVTRFYEHMDTLPKAAGIRALHPPDLEPVRRVLIAYLTEWTGGPPVYSSERGHPRLRRRHLGLPDRARRARRLDTRMRQALSDVVTDAELRSSLERAFFGLADFLRNRQEEPAEQSAAGNERR